MAPSLLKATVLKRPTFTQTTHLIDAYAKNFQKNQVFQTDIVKSWCNYLGFGLSNCSPEMSKLWLPIPAVPIFQSRSNSMLNNRSTDLKFFLYQLIIKSIDLPFLWIKSLLGIYFSAIPLLLASSIDENKFWSALLNANSKSTAVFSVGLYFPKKVATWTLVGAISWIMGS
jgi:hypothetical protein